MLNSDLSVSTISVTNGTDRDLQINNVKKIGNVCYVNLVFGIGSSAYNPSQILATLNGITANGRAYLMGYITNAADDIAPRQLYIENNDSRLKLAELTLNSGYLLVVQGCFVTN